jgi:hypothetical protein
MNKSSNVTTQSLSNNDQTSVTQHGDKPEDLPQPTFYTGEQWELDMLETCKRVNTYTSEQKRALAKRQF